MGNYRKDKITLSYNKARKCFTIAYPKSLDRGLVLNHIIGDVCISKKKEPFNCEVFNLKNELEKRGYDITTLKFSIQLKKIEE